MTRARDFLACLAAVMTVSALAADVTTKPVVAPKPATATQPAATTKPATPSEADATPTIVTDALTNTVDPFSMADQKTKFLKLAGNTGELNAKSFEVDRKAGGNLIMPFEKWETAIAFDKNKNTTLDWFEFEAYRQAMRKAVLAACDKNKDNKLTGDERTAALKLLAEGKLDIKPDPEQRTGALPPKLVAPEDGDGKLNDDEMTESRAATIRGWEFIQSPMREFALRNFDADGDGKFDNAEWQAFMAFQEERWKIDQDWIRQMLGLDKDTRLEQLEEIMEPIVDNALKALGKRANPDDGEPAVWYQSENMIGHVGDMANGFVLHLVRLEQQVLADHGGKPSDATRAALIKAYAEDLRQRVEKADVDKKGHLTRQEAEAFLIELMDEHVKAGYEYGQAQKKKQKKE